MNNVFFGGMDLIAGLFLLGILEGYTGLAKMIALFMVAKGTLEIFPAIR